MRHLRGRRQGQTGQRHAGHQLGHHQRQRRRRRAGQGRVAAVAQPRPQPQRHHGHGHERGQLTMAGVECADRSEGVDTRHRGIERIVDLPAHERAEGHLHEQHAGGGPGPPAEGPQGRGRTGGWPIEHERLDRGPEQQLHDHERHQHVRGDDPRGQFVGHDASAEPALEASQQQRRHDRPHDARLAAMPAPRRHGRGEDGEAHAHAEQPVQVLGPHQRGIELRGVELRR